MILILHLRYHTNFCEKGSRAFIAVLHLYLFYLLINANGPMPAVEWYSWFLLINLGRFDVICRIDSFFFQYAELSTRKQNMGEVVLQLPSFFYLWAKNNGIYFKTYIHFFVSIQISDRLETVRQICVGSHVNIWTGNSNMLFIS